MANSKKSTTPKELKQTEIVKEEITSQNLSIKNKAIVICVVIILVLGGLYIYKWKQVKNEEKLMTSYLINSGTINLEINNLSDVNQVLSESPIEYFVLINYTNNEATYNLEYGIKQIIDDYKLNDVFYYYNATDLMKEENYLNKLNEAFKTDLIKTVPIILYFREGKIVDIVKRNDNNVINAGDFQKLLDIYDYEGQ